MLSRESIVMRRLMSAVYRRNTTRWNFLRFCGTELLAPSIRYSGGRNDVPAQFEFRSTG